MVVRACMERLPKSPKKYGNTGYIGTCTASTKKLNSIDNTIKMGKS